MYVTKAASPEPQNASASITSTYIESVTLGADSALSIVTVAETHIEIHAPRVAYEKDVRSIDELLAHLSAKGLGIDNEELATTALTAIGYYRLIPYMRNFQDDGNKRFQPGATISHVLDLYEFDRRLRLFFADALERLEVGVRVATEQPFGLGTCAC